MLCGSIPMSNRSPKPPQSAILARRDWRTIRLGFDMAAGGDARSTGPKRGRLERGGPPSPPHLPSHRRGVISERFGVSATIVKRHSAVSNRFPAEPIGLLAGSGRFPILIAEAARRQGLRVACVGIRYEASEELRGLCGSF